MKSVVFWKKALIDTFRIPNSKFASHRRIGAVWVAWREDRARVKERFVLCDSQNQVEVASLFKTYVEPSLMVTTTSQFTFIAPVEMPQAITETNCLVALYRSSLFAFAVSWSCCGAA